MSVDPLLAQYIRAAAPEDRPALATAAGEADTIARYLPAHALPAAVRATWLVERAWRADRADSPHRDALWSIALAAVTDASQQMDPIVFRAPTDPSGLTT